MSICSNATRTLSRCRVPTGTLLPFLYQTTTIQRWTFVVRPARRRHVNSRSKYADDIPFEDDSLPSSIEQDSAQQTTITGSERAAFQKLYRKFSARLPAVEGQDIVEPDDELSGQQYSCASNSHSAQLDKVFDEAMKGGLRSRTSEEVMQRPKVPAKYSEQVDGCNIANVGLESTRHRRQKAKVVATKLKQAEKDRVDKLLQGAQTDQELWQVLHREVLDKVRKLDLDAPPVQPQLQDIRSLSEPMASNARIVFQNYPHHLVTAVSVLRNLFPSSPLPSSILPTIKSLGRSSYALGATTLLYRHLIRAAWVQQASYDDIDMLLTDMNHGAIEYDADILALLDSIIKEYEVARIGHVGREMQLVSAMGRSSEGIKKVRQWRAIVADRLGIVSKEMRLPLRAVKKEV